MSRCLFKSDRSELDKSDESRSPAHFLCFITAVLFNDERQKLAIVCRKTNKHGRLFSCAKFS